MKQLRRLISQHPLYLFLLAIPLVLIAHFGGWPSEWVFVLSALGVIPLAGLIGEATESLAVYTGPKVGGLLNATLGNAAELIITLVAVNAGLLDLVKASIIGSVLGNLLMVLGFSMVLGGAKNGVQKFDRRQAGNYATLLVLAVIALGIPSLFSTSMGPTMGTQVEEFSLGVAVVMILLYILGLIYTLKVEDSPITYDMEKEKPIYNRTNAIIVLVIATVGVVVLSELLVGAVESVVSKFGISEFFLGIVLIPIVGNVAEHLVAVQVALRNKMELSLEIALSSSLQIALFVAPILVFVSLALGHPLTLIFNQFELIALVAAVVVSALVASDGESNWLEGAALLAVYTILAIGFFLLPA